MRVWSGDRLWLEVVTISYTRLSHAIHASVWFYSPTVGWGYGTGPGVVVWLLAVLDSMPYSGTLHPCGVGW